MASSQGLFRGTKAVVFGGCGFLGSHVAGALVRGGADTLVYDLAPRHKGVPAEAVFVQGDVLDAAAVRGALAGADRVLAFTGSGGAPASLRDPLGDLAGGCQAQLILLEAVRAVCPEATVVFPGSRLEYGRPQRLPVAESHPLAGDTPYAIHKSTCAAYYRMYAQVHGLRTIVLRLSNPYGPHPLEQRYKGFGILNHFMDQASLGRPIQLFGDGSQLRDFVFVDDVVEAVLGAAARPDLAGTVTNIGSGEGVSLASIAQQIIDLSGCGSIEQVPWPQDQSRIETGDFYFDISRARKLLRWHPRISLGRGLQLTMAARRDHSAAVDDGRSGPTGGSENRGR